MANIKFSAFTQKVVQTNVDFLVGYTGADNVRITPAALGDGIYLPLGGGNMTGDLVCNDGVAAAFGTGVDAFFKHDGANFNFFNDMGNVTFNQRADDKDIIFNCDDGAGGTATYFYLDGSAANPGNYLITLFPDNSRLVLGDGWDIQMWHDGVDGKFYNATGDWSFEQAANDKDIIFYCDDGAGGTTAYLTIDGGAENISIAKTTIHPDSIATYWGDANDLQIYHDGSNSYISDTGTGDLVIKASNNMFFESSAGASKIIARTGGAVDLYHNGSKKIETTATGIEVTDEVSIGTSLVHTGDTDTKVAFTTNNITLIAGGATHLVAESDQTTILYSGNAQTLFCDTNQNVGIGTTSPATKLDVAVAATNRIQLGTSIAGNIGDYVGGLYYSSNKLLIESFLVGTGYQPLLLSPNGGNVGIGTTTPVAKLSVTGASAAANDIGIFQVTTGTGAHTDTKLTVGVVDNDYAWVEAGTPGIAIRDFMINPRGGGNVGIGNTNPNQSGLGIDHTVVTIGTATGMGMMELTGTRTSDGDLGRIAWLNAATRRSEIVVSRIDENTSTKMAFSTSNAGSMGTRMTIAKDGKVGIGTITPSYNLDIDDAGGSVLQLNDSAGRYLRLRSANSGAQSVNISSYSGLHLGGTDNSNDLTVASTGNVGIGIVAPTAALQVVGLVEYADNAAALTAGLTAGAFYRTGDLLKVVH